MARDKERCEELYTQTSWTSINQITLGSLNCVDRKDRQEPSVLLPGRIAMPPKYPFARSNPSAVASSSNPNSNSNINNGNGRPIVVSASGVAPNSPAAGLSTASPSTLRSRIPSPRTHTGVSDTFQNDTSSYPSPSAVLAQDKGKGKRKKNKSEGGARGWLRVESESPSRGIEIPRYDSRGYPTRDRPSDPRLSPESAKSIRFSNGIRPSTSRDSLVSDVSSTGAGVDGDPGRFLSPERPSSYYAPIDGASPSALYPPTMNYALSAPSYSPFETNPARMVDPGSVPSLYGDSRVSLHSITSEHSMTHFKKYDSLRDMYPAFSISSKGGKRSIGDMVSMRLAVPGFLLTKGKVLPAGRSDDMVIPWSRGG